MPGLRCRAAREFVFRFAAFGLLLAGPLAAGEGSYPRAEDVGTLDGILAAYYDVVSGPPGPRDVERDKSLHWPGARAGILADDPELARPVVQMMTLDEYHERSAPLFAKGFYEREIHREVVTFGEVTHAWSTYETRATPDGPVTGRGVNSIQLFHDGRRWWITSWIYAAERPDRPIPPEFLPPTR